ncbi:hypothetical protein FQN49_003903 [Arthroderma sp. PD_2]|nr:hypothetical protein FQN49_003903 [Arthroderma sp. PD_2]
MTRTALVTGASGLLGRQVLKAFQQDGSWTVTGQGFTRASPPEILKADLTVAAEVEKLLDDVKCSFTVSHPSIQPYMADRYEGAANRFPDKCDADPSLARAINVEATRTLAHATATRSILLIYISTDYVFSGVEGEAPYETSSPTNPPNIYGLTKRDGEEAVLQQTGATGKGVVLRIPVLYGPATTNSDSAVNVLLDAVEKARDANAAVKMDDWSKRYPTHTEDVARVCRDIAVRYLGQDGSLPVVLQFSSDVQTTKYQMCELFAELLGVSIPGMVRVTDGGKPGEGVQRPYDTHLSTRALREVGISVDTQDFRAWCHRRRRRHIIRSPPRPATRPAPTATPMMRLLVRLRLKRTIPWVAGGGLDGELDEPPEQEEARDAADDDACDGAAA